MLDLRTSGTEHVISLVIVGFTVSISATFTMVFLLRSGFSEWEVMFWTAVPYWLAFCIHRVKGEIN